MLPIRHYTVSRLKELANQEDLPVPKYAKKQAIYNIVQNSPVYYITAQGSDLEHLEIIGIHKTHEEALTNLDAVPYNLRVNSRIIKHDSSKKKMKVDQLPKKSISPKLSTKHDPYVYVPESYAMEDIREDWIDGVATKSDIENFTDEQLEKLTIGGESIIDVGKNYKANNRGECITTVYDLEHNVLFFASCSQIADFYEDENTAVLFA